MQTLPLAWIPDRYVTADGRMRIERMGSMWQAQIRSGAIQWHPLSDHQHLSPLAAMEECAHMFRSPDYGEADDDDNDIDW